jgi:REP element-mobilizing transposase RayT
VSREKHNTLIAAGGMLHHVHLLVSVSRETSVAEVVRLVKANSSKWIRETFPDVRMFACQAGYGALAVNFSNVESVSRYLANQAEHHKKQTFQEESIAFLQRHQLAYDERHLWD